MITSRNCCAACKVRSKMQDAVCTMTCHWDTEEAKRIQEARKPRAVTWDSHNGWRQVTALWRLDPVHVGGLKRSSFLHSSVQHVHGEALVASIINISPPNETCRFLDHRCKFDSYFIDTPSLGDSVRTCMIALSGHGRTVAGVVVNFTCSLNAKSYPRLYCNPTARILARGWQYG